MIQNGTMISNGTMIQNTGTMMSGTMISKDNSFESGTMIASGTVVQKNREAAHDFGTTVTKPEEFDSGSVVAKPQSEGHWSSFLYNAYVTLVGVFGSLCLTLILTREAPKSPTPTPRKPQVSPPPVVVTSASASAAERGSVPSLSKELQGIDLFKTGTTRPKKTSSGKKGEGLKVRITVVGTLRLTYSNFFPSCRASTARMLAYHCHSST